LIQTGAGLGLGFGAGAISLASALFERGYVSADRALRFGYIHSFLFDNIVSALRVPSFLRAQKRQYFDDWLTHVAILVLLLLVVSLVAVLISRQRQLLLKIGTVRAAIVVTVFSLLVTTRLSSPLWRTIPQLPYMQFPYRWLVVATFGSCLLAGVAASTVTRGFKLKYHVVAALAGVLCLTGWIDKKAINRASYDRQTLEVSLSIPESPEYRTRWRDKNARDKKQLPPLVATEGDASIDVIDGEGAKQSYVVNAHTASTLRLRQLYFPGWVARVDGSPIAISPDQSGNMQLKVEPGEHMLDLDFEDTWPRTAGKVTSAATALALLIMAYFTSAFHRKRSTLLASDGERQDAQG
jgi:hypothetical protein